MAKGDNEWILKLSNQAEKDLKWLRENNKNLYVKCFDLTRAVIQNPVRGIGKPESSRRINHEHRIVYEIFNNLIVVAAYRYHY